MEMEEYHLLNSWLSGKSHKQIKISLRAKSQLRTPKLSVI